LLTSKDKSMWKVSNLASNINSIGGSYFWKVPKTAEGYKYYEIEVVDARYGYNSQISKEYFGDSGIFHIVQYSKAPYISKVVPSVVGSGGSTITIYGKNLVSTNPSGIKIEFLKFGKVFGSQKTDITTYGNESLLKFRLSTRLFNQLLNNNNGVNYRVNSYQIHVVNNYGASNVLNFIFNQKTGISVLPTCDSLRKRNAIWMPRMGMPIELVKPRVTCIEPGSPIGAGDINGDGQVDISDIVLVKGYLAGTTKLTPEQIKRADVNGDGKVTKRDVNLIRDYSINGLIHKLPVMIGDVNSDGQINCADLTALRDMLVGKVQSVSSVGDLNMDGKVDISDVVLLQKKLLNKGFSCGEGGITVLSPNGGDNLILGKTYKIRWTTSNAASRVVDILLFRGDNFVKNIVLDHKNYGQYANQANWTVPFNLSIGTDYRISVISQEEYSVRGSSSYFTIVPTQKPIVLTLGDVNGDEQIDISDVILAKGYLAGSIKLTPDQIKRADVDADGRVTKRDVELIMDYSIGLIHKFPAIIGNVNGDGQINCADLTALMKMSLGNGQATGLGDLNADGKVDISDVVLLNKELLSKGLNCGNQNSKVTNKEINPIVTNPFRLIQEFFHWIGSGWF